MLVRGALAARAWLVVVCIFAGCSSGDSSAAEARGSVRGLDAGIESVTAASETDDSAQGAESGAMLPDGGTSPDAGQADPDADLAGHGDERATSGEEDAADGASDDAGGSGTDLDSAVPLPSDASEPSVDSSAPTLDAGASADGSEAGSTPDATAPDATGSGEDALAADAGADCTRDADCAAHAYCSREDRSCRPRCDRDGCIGPTISATNNRVVSDGEHLCYADDSAPEGERGVRAWDGRAAHPSTLSTGSLAQVLLIADGYCYFASPSVHRTLLGGGTPEPVQELAAAPQRSFLTQDSVWWAAPRADVLDLYRLRRAQGATAELVTSVAPTQLWEAGNRTHLFRRFNPMFGKCAIAMAPIADLTQETIIPMSFSKNCTGAMWASDESVVFTQFEPVHYYPFRVDLANPGVENTIRLHSVELLMYQVRGDWMYAQSVVDGSSVPGVPSTVSYQRATLAGGPTERLFTPTPGTATYRVRPSSFEHNVERPFAVLQNLLVYQHAREQRLIAVPLPE